MASKRSFNWSNAMRFWFDHTLTLLPCMLICMWLPSANADDAQVCAKVAELEDAGRLYTISAPVEGEVEHLDFDGDGDSEKFTYVPSWQTLYAIDGISLGRIAPDWRSVSVTSYEIILLDGAYYGVTRDKEILTLLWRFVLDAENESIKSKFLCRFDREWREKETSACKGRYKKDNFDRVKFNNRRRHIKRDDYIKPPFLDKVYSFYHGLVRNTEPIRIDLDNDGKEELVGGILIGYPSPNDRTYEMPVIVDASNDHQIEPSFQNARLIQFLGTEKDTKWYSDELAQVSFLKPRRDNGEIYIEDSYNYTPFVSGPEYPFRQVYRLRGVFPEKMCEAEWDWTTVFSMKENW